MSTNHRGGNIQNEITVEEHDGVNNAKRVNIVAGDVQLNSQSTIFIGTPTLYAVVNTSAAGQASVVLDNSISNIGFATVHVGTPTLFAVVNTGAVGVQNSMVTLNAGPNYIGLVTVANTVPVTGTFWQATQPISGNVGILGNVTINPSVNSIGFATVAVGSPIAAGVNFIGHMTVRIAANANTYIGLVTATVGNTTRTITGNLTLSDSKNYIGLTTTTLGTGLSNIGFATVAVSTPTLFAVVNTGAPGTTDITSNSGVTVYQGGTWTVTQASSARSITGNVTLSDAKTFVGLVTAWSRNAGTTKTLVNLPLGLGNNSLSTVAVPTNAQKINVTNMLLNSNVTTEIALKSGATYLTGNASLGVTIFPGGGFVLTGAPDSPSWIGLPSGALVVEKRDPGGTVSKVAGHVIYFDE